MQPSAEMDDAYANGAYIEGAEAYPDRWATAAEAFRGSVRANLRVPYGDGAREAFDLFHPEGTPRGVVVFVHGGYWLKFDRALWSHLAAGPIAQGWAVAMPSYDLCPDVRIADITRQIAAAVDEIAQCVQGPIVLAGHSAGGHLVSRMGCADVELGCRDRIKRIIPISPVADLRPLLQTSMNAKFQLDWDEVQAESPISYDAPEAEVTIWVGADERPAFLNQALALGHAWSAPVMEDTGKHHFDIIEGLEDGNSMMCMSLLGGL